MSKASPADIMPLATVMARLRDPDTGCPWDIAQDFASIAPYTIEEAYEVADAIERKDTIDLKEELGDLLLQVVFHAQMAHEAGLFSFDDVAQGIADKMIPRHPHVFGDKVYAGEQDQRADWHRIKNEEKAAKHAAKVAAGLPVESGDPRATLRDIPTGFPALTATDKIQRKAALVGFDHPEMHQIYGKVDEELAEVKEEAEREPLRGDRGGDSPRHVRGRRGDNWGHDALGQVLRRRIHRHQRRVHRSV